MPPIVAAGAEFVAKELLPEAEKLTVGEHWSAEAAAQAYDFKPHWAERNLAKTVGVSSYDDDVYHSDLFLMTPEVRAFALSKSSLAIFSRAADGKPLPEWVISDSKYENRNLDDIISRHNGGGSWIRDIVPFQKLAEITSPTFAVGSKTVDIAGYVELYKFNQKTRLALEDPVTLTLKETLSDCVGKAQIKSAEIAELKGEINKHPLTNVRYFWDERPMTEAAAEHVKLERDFLNPLEQKLREIRVLQLDLNNLPAKIAKIERSDAAQASPSDLAEAGHHPITVEALRAQQRELQREIDKGRQIIGNKNNWDSPIARAKDEVDGSYNYLFLSAKDNSLPKNAPFESRVELDPEEATASLEGFLGLHRKLAQAEYELKGLKVEFSQAYYAYQKRLASYFKGDSLVAELPKEPRQPRPFSYEKMEPENYGKGSNTAAARSRSLASTQIERASDSSQTGRNGIELSSKAATEATETRPLQAFSRPTIDAGKFLLEEAGHVLKDYISDSFSTLGVQKPTAEVAAAAVNTVYDHSAVVFFDENGRVGLMNMKDIKAKRPQILKIDPRADDSHAKLGYLIPMSSRSNFALVSPVLRADGEAPMLPAIGNKPAKPRLVVTFVSGDVPEDLKIGDSFGKLWQKYAPPKRTST
jgi:hypothetical protein